VPPLDPERLTLTETRPGREDDERPVPVRMASISASTSSVASGTTSCRAFLGRFTPVQGEDAITRSATAARKIAAT